MKKIVLLMGLLISMSILCNAQDVSVNITKESNYIVLRSQGPLIGLNVWLNNNFDALGAPENVLSGLFLSSNISPTSYQIGIMSVSPPADGNILMKLPILKTILTDLTSNLSIHLNINGIDKDFKIDLSTGIVTRITENKKIIISIFPNPVMDNLKIDYGTTNLNNCSIILTNIIGQIVYSEPIKYSKTNINFSAFSNGMYNLQVINEQNKVIISEKIIKK